MNDLERRFLHHAPTSVAVAKSHELARRSYLALARILEQLPESRERAMALTQLEQSSFWAHGAIARGQTPFPAIVKALEERQQDPVAAVAPAPEPPIAPESAPETAVGAVGAAAPEVPAAV